jgi:MoaA/NifB/PqqE/SkfB family radical SAM enzyme
MGYACHPFMTHDEVYNRFNPYKALVYSDKLQKIADGEIPYPVIWHIYPTNDCVHDCDFCIMKEERKNPASLSRKTLLKAVKEAKRYGAKTIHFSGGGEPLMHPHLYEAIKDAKKIGLKVALSTNGALLSQTILNMVDYPRISLNAGTSETHKRIMNADTFDAIIGKIKRLPEKLKDKIGLGFVITGDNWREVYEFCKLADSLKVNFVHIRPAYQPEEDDKIKRIVSSVAGLADQAKKDFPKLNIYCVKDKFDGYWTERKYSKCRATPMNAVLKANAKFILCQDMLNTEFGDYDKQSFKTIWQSAEHLKRIEEVKLKECPRCVMTKLNEFIQNIYIDNNTINDLI